MSSNLWHDAVNNILHISKEGVPPQLATPSITEESIASESPTKPEGLRGFIVNVADNEEHAKQIREGTINEVHFMPILAKSEEEAMSFIEAQGKIPLSFNSYEYLKFQLDLIEDLSRQENIALLNESPFNSDNVQDIEN